MGLVIGLALEVSQSVGAFLQDIGDGHGELLGNRRAAIIPAHDGLTLHEQLLGIGLYLLHFLLGEAFDEESFCTHFSNSVRAAVLVAYRLSW